MTIADSHAPLAIDLKTKCATNWRTACPTKKWSNYMVARMAILFLYRPPVKRSTWLLWFGPFLLMLGGFAFLLWKLKTRDAQPDSATPAELQRAADLLAAPPRHERLDMTVFLLFAALMLAGALFFVIPPLLQRGPGDTGHQQRDAVNLEILRDQLRELDADRAAGTIDDASYQVRAMIWNCVSSTKCDPTWPRRMRQSARPGRRWHWALLVPAVAAALTSSSAIPTASIRPS